MEQMDCFLVFFLLIRTSTFRYVTKCSGPDPGPRSLSELDSLRLTGEAGEKIRQVTERATLFRITSNAMINVSCSKFMLNKKKKESNFVFKSDRRNTSERWCSTVSQRPFLSFVDAVSVTSGLPGLPGAGSGAQQAMAEGPPGGTGAAREAGGDFGAAREAAQPPGASVPRGRSG